MKKYARMLSAMLIAIMCVGLVPASAANIDVQHTVIDGGMSHTIALGSDGLVRTWGSNQQMQLGSADTTLVQRQPEIVPGLNSVVAVAAGSDYSVALDSRGTVYTWGSGQQSRPTAVPGLSTVVAISAGQTGILALLSNGTVFQWTLGGTPVQVKVLYNVAAISAGSTHYLALTVYGDVYAWGMNPDGRLGLGGTARQDVPKRLNLTNIVDIAAGQNHSLAVGHDGKVYAWGNNAHGQVGSKAQGNALTPVQVTEISKAVQVAAGNESSMAMTEDGKLYTWGYGEYGQLGNNTSSIINAIPVNIVKSSSLKPVAIAAGVYHNVFCAKNGNVYTWGRNRDYQLGIPQNNNATEPQQVFTTGFESLSNYPINAISTASSWAVPELAMLHSKGIVTPLMWQKYQNPTTRAEFTHMLVNIYERVKKVQLTSTNPHFTDIANHVLREDISNAYSIGLINGTSATTFSPDKPLTRQEAAKILCSLLTRLNAVRVPTNGISVAYYRDAAEVANWAVPYVAYAYENKFMTGSSDGRFNPNAPLTKEQSLLLVARMAEMYQW